jgi:hypothetical protein
MDELDRNFWIESPQQRLQKWKNFRRSLSNNSNTMDCLTSVWNIWFFSPDVSMTLDPYDIKKWPTVWEMVQDGNTCKYSKTLGAAYAMYYLNNSLDISIMRVFDKFNKDIYVVSRIEDKLLMPYNKNILNFEDVKNNLDIQESWTINEVLDAILYQVAE